MRYGYIACVRRESKLNQRYTCYSATHSLEANERMWHSNHSFIPYTHSNIRNSDHSLHSLCRTLTATAAAAPDAASAASALIRPPHRRGPVPGGPAVALALLSFSLGVASSSPRHARGRGRRHPQLLVGPRGAPLPLEDSLPQHVHRGRGHLRGEGQGGAASNHVLSLITYHQSQLTMRLALFIITS